jgi:low affinity Fe/Cu permease
MSDYKRDKEAYSKREQDMFYQSIHEKLDEIIAQTRETNGAVANLKQWKAYITGAVSIIVLIGLPLLGYLALQVVDTRTALTAHVQASKAAQALIK